MIRLMFDSEKSIPEELFVRCLSNACALVPELSGAGDLFLDLELLCENEMRVYNRDYMGKDSVTDVLSFPSMHKPPFTRSAYPYDFNESVGALYFGQVLLCPERAREQAKEFGHSYEREICYLFVHSVLHLCGYDHMDPDGEKAMHALAEKILAGVLI